MKTHTLLVAITVALFVIAGNMTYTNITNAKKKEVPASGYEEVVEVVGRYTSFFDGFGAELGFLVKTKSGLKVLDYDQGAMFDNPSWQPKYLTVYWSEKNRPIVVPATVEVW